MSAPRAATTRGNLGQRHRHSHAEIRQADVQGLAPHEFAERHAIVEDLSVEKAGNEDEIGGAAVDQRRNDIDQGDASGGILVGEMGPCQHEDMSAGDHQNRQRTKIFDVGNVFARLRLRLGRHDAAVDHGTVADRGELVHGWSLRA